MSKKVIKHWHWVKVKDKGVCPFCGTCLVNLTFIRGVCPKKGCFYMQGQAFLTPRQVKRYKDILV